MSILTAKITNKQYFKNPYFDFLIELNKSYAQIDIEFFTKEVTTENIPMTFQILEQKLPSILRSKCFNEEKLPFKKEVRATELGHLFEHILLEQICHLKRELGIKNPVHNGVTRWDWYLETRGTFHISLDVKNEDKDILLVAIKKTAVFMIDIIDSIEISRIIRRKDRKPKFIIPLYLMKSEG